MMMLMLLLLVVMLKLIKIGDKFKAKKKCLIFYEENQAQFPIASRPVFGQSCRMHDKNINKVKSTTFFNFSRNCVH